MQEVEREDLSIVKKTKRLTLTIQGNGSFDAGDRQACDQDQGRFSRNNHVNSENLSYLE
jgi:hypothetical protein